MSIDLSQFVATFLEESYEGLEVMESSLLNLDYADEETINTIFRAAHSIKGGAGTFGFNAIADFTHAVETLLDAMRSGKLDVTPGLQNLLLEAVDCISALLAASQDGPEADAELVNQVQLRLERALSGEDVAAEVEVEVKESPALATEHTETDLGQRCWNISLIPDGSLLQQGHEPAFLLEALAELGALQVDTFIDKLPALADINPENLYLSWQLTLESGCSEEDIREIFEWLADECRLEISSTLASAAQRQVAGWEIHFIPDEGLLQAGHEPCLMFAALSELGRLTVEANTASLPGLSQLAGEQLYLSWNLTLISDCSKDQVQEVFDWVADECRLEVKPLAAFAEEAEVIAGAGDGVAPPEMAQPAPQPSEIALSIAEPSQGQASPVHAEQSISATAENLAAENQSSATKPASGPAGIIRATAESSSIRVDTEKLDTLINRVGELVITQAMLGQVGTELAEVSGVDVERLLEGLEQLERNTRDLQEDVMRVRMFPVSFVFNRFPRLVHDVSGKLGKKVELVISGEQTEIDKAVMEKIGDPLVHLIRNSLDHGLEEPDERIQAGKPETGVLQLNAYHQGGFIVIDIVDDGRGLDTGKIRRKALEKGLITDDLPFSDSEINELIFNPGFSTADEVSDLSGRGVGMDVVRRNIESLGGNVRLKSVPGKGSTFSVRLPLTLAIMDGQLVRIHQETYIIPLVSIVETIQADSNAVSPIAGENKLLLFREEYIPLINLRSLFKLPTAMATGEPESNLIAIVESGGQKVGLIVDELFGQQQVVIKSLEVNFKRIKGLAGATILGDGSVALILDIAGLMARGLDFELAAAAKKRNSIVNNQNQENVA